MKALDKKVIKYFICDMCGGKCAGKAHHVYNENFVRQAGIFQCRECFAAQVLGEEYKPQNVDKL